MNRLLFILLFLFGLGCQAESTALLRIATAASLAPAAREIALAFEDKKGIKCEIISGSSGKLTGQIRSGAPFDVFLSASEFYTLGLQKDGFVEDPALTFTTGHLVFCAQKKDTLLLNLRFTNPQIRHIALADPTLAPYGAAAMDYLVDNEFPDSLKDQLVYGKNVAQATQFVLSGNAELGFSSLSLMLQGEGKPALAYRIIAPHLHRPLSQVAVVVKSEGGPKENAAAFRDFLLTATADEILERNGFGSLPSSLPEEIQ